MDDTQLDALLAQRKAPPAPTHLAGHIIALAMQAPATCSLADVIASLALPKPAYTLAALLCISMAIGWQINPESMSESAAFMYYEESLL